MFCILRIRCFLFLFSKLCIQDDFVRLSLQQGPGMLSAPLQLGAMAPQKPCSDDSSPDTPQPQLDLKQGWIEGIFGCLRPMLSIIGKANTHEMRRNQGTVKYTSCVRLTYFCRFMGKRVLMYENMDCIIFKHLFIAF